MFTISPFATSSLLVLLTTTLTTAAYARGGGHSGSNGSSGFSAPVHSDARILITGPGNKTLSKAGVTRRGDTPPPIVRDHRYYGPDVPVFSDGRQYCGDSCVGEGGLDVNARPAPQQNPYVPRAGKVIDHRN